MWIQLTGQHENDVFFWTLFGCTIRKIILNSFFFQIILSHHVKGCVLNNVVVSFFSGNYSVIIAAEKFDPFLTHNWSEIY